MCTEFTETEQTHALEDKKLPILFTYRVQGMGLVTYHSTIGWVGHAK